MRDTASFALRKWVGLATAGLVAGLGLVLGLWQSQPAQHVIFYTAATFALVAWAWNSFALPGAMSGSSSGLTAATESAVAPHATADSVAGVGPLDDPPMAPGSANEFQAQTTSAKVAAV